MNILSNVSLILFASLFANCKARKATTSEEKGSLEAFGRPYIRVYLKNEQVLASKKPNPQGCDDIKNPNCIVYKVICNQSANTLKDANPTTPDTAIFDESICNETPEKHAAVPDAVEVMPLREYAWLLGEILGIDSTVPGPSVSAEALQAQLTQLQAILETAKNRPAPTDPADSTNRDTEIDNIQRRIAEQQRIIEQYPAQLPSYETVQIFIDFIKLPQIQSASRVVQVGSSQKEFGTLLLAPFLDKRAVVDCGSPTGGSAKIIPQRHDGTIIGNKNGYSLATETCLMYVKTQKHGLVCTLNEQRNTAIARIDTGETVTVGVGQSSDEKEDCARSVVFYSTPKLVCALSEGQIAAISTTKPFKVQKLFNTWEECGKFIVGPPITPAN